LNERLFYGFSLDHTSVEDFGEEFAAFIVYFFTGVNTDNHWNTSFEEDFAHFATVASVNERKFDLMTFDAFHYLF